MNNTYAVVLRKLVKEFEGRRVLDISELQFEKGMFYCFTGHNGSGKTTLLRIIAGLETMDTGEMKLGVTAGRIGFCPQKPYMFQTSVKKNLIWGLAKNKIEKAREMAKRLGIEHLLDRRADKLSDGEAQRVSIGRMLLFEPELLLLDEPTSNLDAEGRRIIDREIKDYVDQGNTCISATHLSEQTTKPSLKVVCLEKGQ